MGQAVSIPEVVYAAKAGEASAWKLLYDRHYPILYASALRILGNTPAAKDAVQDTFLKAYLQLEQLKEVSAFGSWAKQILIHDCYRKHRRQTSIVPLESDTWWDNEIERKQELFAANAHLSQAIESLAEPLRCTLLLRYFSSFQSYGQIAEILGVPLGTVCSRLKDARVKLSHYWHNSNEGNDRAYRFSEEWNGFYFHHFGGMYQSELVRNRLIQHMDKKLEITFTSGKIDAGRDFIEKEINDDLYFGSLYQPVNVISCGNISIVEGTNYNPPEYADRCPESSVFVLYRNKGKVNKLNLYNSPQ